MVGIVELVASVHAVADLRVPDGTFADVGLDDGLEHEHESVRMVDGYAEDERPLERTDAHAARAAWRQLDAALFYGELHSFDERVVDASLGLGGAVDLSTARRGESSDVAFRLTANLEPSPSFGVDDGLVAVGTQYDRKCTLCSSWHGYSRVAARR